MYQLRCCSALLAMAIVALAGVPARALDNTIAQWDLTGDLTPTLGAHPLIEGAAPGRTVDYIFDNVAINGSPADVLHFQRGTWFQAMPGIAKNGGGGYVNQYTIIMDVMFPNRRDPNGDGWASIYNTNTGNANDGDWFIDDTDPGGIGISGVYGGSVPDGAWHRLARVVDLVAGTLVSYVDGVKVQENSGELVDDRFSLYSSTDGAAEGVLLFGDENGDDTEGYLNSIQMRGRAMSAAEIAGLGGPTANGIPIPVHQNVPAANVYGLGALSLLLLGAGAVALRGRKATASA